MSLKKIMGCFRASGQDSHDGWYPHKPGVSGIPSGNEKNPWLTGKSPIHWRIFHCHDCGMVMSNDLHHSNKHHDLQVSLHLRWFFFYVAKTIPKPNTHGKNTYIIGHWYTLISSQRPMFGYVCIQLLDTLLAIFGWTKFLERFDVWLMRSPYRCCSLGCGWLGKGATNFTQNRCHPIQVV